MCDRLAVEEADRLNERPASATAAGLCALGFIHRTGERFAAVDCARGSGFAVENADRLGPWYWFAGCSQGQRPRRRSGKRLGFAVEEADNLGKGNGDDIAAGSEERATASPP